MRISSLALPILLLAACSKGGAGGSTATAGATSGADRISCALAGARDFAPDCTLEQSHKNGEEFWVVRHPDGGFRRFQIIDNGKRIATADGAEEVAATRSGANLEVRVGNERYLFPAAPDPVEASSDAGPH